MNHLMKVLASVALLSLAGCASDSERPAEQATPPPDASTTEPYSGPSAGAATESTMPSASMPNIRVIYFAFDSSELGGDGQALVDGWAAYLAANPNARVKLEGHCDERGTREYNVGLGERRANAVLQALTSRGASERQLSVSSFGEERPVAEGHDEAAWGQNRRVELR
ncbi:MAG: peptidoglycan-associated lipoprotein Pal [Gammaproteobacteria bacterium]